MVRRGGPLVFLAALGLSAAHPVRGAGAEIEVVTDPDCFAAAAAPLTEVDFEGLPFFGSSCPELNDQQLPNPLTLSGVKFTGRGCLRSAFCSSPTCEPDPDGARGGNIVLFLSQGSTVEFPPGTRAALLEVQGIAPYPFRVRAADRAGEKLEASGKGVDAGATHLGFIAPRGLASLEILESRLLLPVAALSFGERIDLTGLPCAGAAPGTWRYSMPRAAGSIRRLPELGVLEPAPVGSSVVARYFKTTSYNREFWRGFFEFAIPEFEGSVLEGRLIVHPGSDQPFEPGIFELSSYRADLFIDNFDFLQPTTFLAYSDDLDPTGPFSHSLDVARVLDEFRGKKLGFRLKLTLDPELDEPAAFDVAFEPWLEFRTAALFRRGDADASGKVELSDAVVVIGLLFLGEGGGFPCERSADADDSGLLDLSDPVTILWHLFLGGPPPRAPFLTCGEDATADALSCRSFPPCR